MADNTPPSAVPTPRGQKRPGRPAVDTLINPRPTNRLRLTHSTSSSPQLSDGTQTQLDLQPLTDHQHLAARFQQLEATDTIVSGKGDPVKRRKQYSREFKLEAISELEKGTLSCYTLSKLIGIDHSMLQRWKENKSKILAMRVNQYKGNSGRAAALPLLEDELHAKFLVLRGPDMRVRVKKHWFMAEARRLLVKHYPHLVTVNDDNKMVYGFAFSNNWFHLFKQRKDVSKRAITNTAQKVPAEYINSINSFHLYIRRQALREGFIQQDVGCFKLGNICNLDQTPIEFDFLSGGTYDTVGAKTVSVKSHGSGLEKRQATVQLAIFGNAKNKIKPTIIFHGLGTKLMKSSERHTWDKRVRVVFQKDAWADEKVMLSWLETDWRHAVELNSGQFTAGNTEPRLLILDVH